MKLAILIGLVWATIVQVSVSVAQQTSITANCEVNSFTYIVQAGSPGQLSNSSQTDEQISSAVDAYVEGQRRKQHIPGAAIALIRDGRLLKARGYGLANVELDVPVKPETIFQTASVGKQFTATGVMMLVEEGKIGLDDKITKYIQESPAAWKDITIRNLLTHTSGIADIGGDVGPLGGGVVDMRKDYTENELVQAFAKLPVDFAPGEKWSYSNTGYVLLGIIIGRIAGKYYGDFLQERIFRPLDMTSTRIISEADIIPNRSAGYELVNGEIKNQQWVSSTFNSTADGSLYTNVLDLAKWDVALDMKRLLKKSSFDQMWTPVVLSDGKPFPYGFGWRIKEVNGHRLIEHSGGWQGFTTQISRYVDDRLTVVVLTNLDSSHSDPLAMAHIVASYYVPAVGPGAVKTIADKEPQVTALVRSSLADLTAGHTNVSSFSPDSQKDWVPERINGLSELLKSLGKLKSIDLIERKQDGSSCEYEYLAMFNNRAMIVNLTLGTHGLIDGFQIVSW
jgi:CubicO group peptidase (beta-lactamase class C family)